MSLVSSLFVSIKGVDLDIIDGLLEYLEMFKTSFLLRTFITPSFTLWLSKPLYEFDLP